MTDEEFLAYVEQRSGDFVITFDEAYRLHQLSLLPFAAERHASDVIYTSEKVCRFIVNIARQRIAKRVHWRLKS